MPSARSSSSICKYWRLSKGAVRRSLTQTTQVGVVLTSCTHCFRTLARILFYSDLCFVTVKICCPGTQRTEILSPFDLRIEEVRHHMRIESAVLEGSKNAIKLLQSTKSQDKKALQKAQISLSAASAKLELLRMSLEKRLEELARTEGDHGTITGKMAILQKEIEAASPTALASGSSVILSRLQANSALAKSAAVTGKLHVRWVWAQNTGYLSEQQAQKLWTFPINKKKIYVSI